jgi:hypothetical protein
MPLKRQLSDLFECALDARVVSRGVLPTLLEEEYLTRFFDHFEIDCVFDVGANAG